MRRFRYIILSTIALLMVSCTIETSDNGNLDGFWHLERVDTLSTGGTYDYSNRLVFWSVEHNLLQMNEDTTYIYMRFRQTSDSLIVNEPFKSNAGHGTDIKLDDVSELSRFGVEAYEVGYIKEKLSGSRMVLRSPKLRLYFKKF